MPSSIRAVTCPAIVAVLALAGCGGSSHGGGTGSSSGTGTTPAPAATTSSGAGSSAAPSSHGATSHTVGPAPGSGHSAISRPEFVSLANTVCREVQGGGPPPLIANPTAPTLPSQATAALPAARRTSTSLQRVGVRTSRGATVGPVVRDYGRLIGLYSRAAVSAHGASGPRSLARSIRLVEQRIEVDARRAGVPVCADGGP